MKIRDKQALEQLLSNAEKNEVPVILGQWLQDVGWGTEVEACKLIEFIKVWDQFNIKTRTRDKITAMINANISHRIVAHFTGLERKGATLKPHSTELLLYLAYGPDGISKGQEKDERLNNQIVQDGLDSLTTKGVESIRNASRRLITDRTTIRANRKDERYLQGTDLIKRVIKQMDKQ